MSMKEAASKYGEWVYRGILLVAMAAMLWLNQNYVTRSEFNAKVVSIDTKNDTENKANVAAHLAIQSSVADVATTLKLLAASQARMEDHETRLRSIESRQAEILAQLRLAKP